uniref:ATP-dependent DNA helicase n=1 Tax=Amphimedon queenslandica TaxID=400682 RepID=A0A1X7SED2_AMPQE
MFISGVGGTGKSFLIEAIKCLVDDIWHSKSRKIMCLVAPTGIAAFNVGGLTIHRLFQLPIEHEGMTAGYWALNKEAQKRIKMTLKNLKITIVDEVSMVSSLNLAYLHLRLENMFGTDKWFGSKNNFICR